MISISKIISSVRAGRPVSTQHGADPNTEQAPMPVRKPALVDHRPEVERLAEAIDLRIGGAPVPFDVLRVKEKDGCKIVHIYAHTPAGDDDDDDDDGSNDTENEIDNAGPSAEIKICLATEKWWKDVTGEIMYVADGNSEDGGKFISALFYLADLDDEVADVVADDNDDDDDDDEEEEEEEEEEDYVKVYHEFQPEEIDPSKGQGALE
ncbi:hypothetical protein CDEST_13850 [Colletotrichum destructivum]|uniref:Uncharacterized protein n=1 Tax=Colletotrichum destructivum TaxID=34406 RepID=A0AAX4J0H1_9PEZI|nr:hypothetical protein CDEST_13850 [Colletotrichum destructivum]